MLLEEVLDEKELQNSELSTAIVSIQKELATITDAISVVVE